MTIFSLLKVVMCESRALPQKTKEKGDKDRAKSNIITVERDGHLWEEDPNSLQHNSSWG